MPVETGTYISDLDATNPASSDPVAQGLNHLQLIKSLIKNTFPSITGAVTATHTALNAIAAALSGGVFTVPATATSHVGGKVILTGQGTDLKTGIANLSGAFSVLKDDATAIVS